MRKPSRGLRLALEARDDLVGLRAVELFAADRLDGRSPSDDRVPPVVHERHRARAQLAADFVAAERGGRGGIGHRTMLLDLDPDGRVVARALASAVFDVDLR